jgi:hypothetical protein
VGTAGVDFAQATTRSGDVTAVASPTTITLTALQTGTAGNLVATTETGANLSFGSASLIGGTQTTEFPRINITSDAGDPIVGVPIELKKACAEYALRASVSPLLVDGPAPVVGGERQPTGEVVSTSVGIGPLRTSTTFANGGGGFGTGTLTTDECMLQAIPAADTLIEYLMNSSGIQRKALR